MERKHYTVEQANMALPEIRKVVGTIQDRMSWLQGHRPEIRYLVQEFKIPFDAPVAPDYLTHLLELRDALGEVDTLGCQIKDIRMGLVDFPSRLFGKEVLLCWRVGEDAVEFYHDLESGYSGRRPIPEDAPGRGSGSDKSTEGSHN
jgi:hypothetical protein